MKARMVLAGKARVVMNVHKVLTRGRWQRPCAHASALANKRWGDQNRARPGGVTRPRRAHICSELIPRVQAIKGRTDGTLGTKQNPEQEDPGAGRFRTRVVQRAGRTSVLLRPSETHVVPPSSSRRDRGHGPGASVDNEYFCNLYLSRVLIVFKCWSWLCCVCVGGGVRVRGVQTSQTLGTSQNVGPRWRRILPKVATNLQVILL